jgi:putative tricarboxylic transport membrane protein
MAETQLRRALQLNLGDPWSLVESPVAATLLALALIALVAPLALKGLGRFRSAED